MSYARFGCEGSDVYVFAHVGGFIQCCGCCLSEKPFQSADFYSTDAAIEHMRNHIMAGHNVPDNVIPDLEADRNRDD